VGGAGDEVALSDWERGVLADLEASLYADDPGLARRLGAPGERRFRQLRSLRSSPRVQLVGAASLVVVGVAVTLATFTRSVWLGFAGVCLLGMGSTHLLLLLARRQLPVHVPRIGWARRGAA
jgi:hypothetical protein